MDFGSGFSLSPKDSLEEEALYDVLVAGSGPAGLNAALYARRKGLRVAILAKKKGGQLLDTSVVENYLGIQGLSGEQLAGQFLEHVRSLEVPLVEDAEITSVVPGNSFHLVTTATGKTFRTRTLVVATGSKPRTLDIPGEAAYAGKGVAYCAICDAPLFRDKDVFVAGGGNSAVEAALDLAKVARSVTLVHRSRFRADQILVDRLLAHPKVDVHLQTRILEILGERAMTGLLVQDLGTGEPRVLAGDGIFIEIGHIPLAGPFAEHVDTNVHGEILVNAKNETSIPGIFAAGDVTQVPYKQIVIAAGEGAKAALAASEYIQLLPPDQGTLGETDSQAPQFNLSL
ncbi:FAD-dependent oxidoreductase [Clostridiales bacterium F-3ap]|uniref:FAD-dependent oxidoreductase n=2 Tax=Anaerotalea alkaliphila TaxID=2662126 RepID=A0A7X5KLD6_9FIRM|nr:FAD-dependent oxidoreductase [Anaerotalea alkaliphila]